MVVRQNAHKINAKEWIFIVLGAYFFFAGLYFSKKMTIGLKNFGALGCFSAFFLFFSSWVVAQVE
jgi:hypothetical protein